MRKPAPAAVTADDVAMFSSFTGTSAVDDSARRDTDRAADAADGAWNAEAVLRAASASRSLGIFESMWRDEASWREDRQGSTWRPAASRFGRGFCAQSHRPPPLVLDD
jgi:hypothetical protein